MDVHHGIILGILQGLTEFLPVSSSGHLVMGQRFFNVTDPALFFDVSVHLGTLVAVCVVFFTDIKRLITDMVRALAPSDSGVSVTDRLKNDGSVRLAGLIILGSVPTAVIGLCLERYITPMFSSLLLTGLMLLVTGTFLWASRYARQADLPAADMGKKRAFFIGAVQGLAVIPGISRSGSTIVAGMFVGVERSQAARYSFLLSIPAVLGAQVFGIRSALESGMILDKTVAAGTIAAFITGYLSLVVLLKIVENGRFYRFAPYCWIIGTIAAVAALA